MYTEEIQVTCEIFHGTVVYMIPLVRLAQLLYITSVM